jgi:hypothetical protein
MPSATASTSEGLALELRADMQEPEWARTRVKTEVATTDRCFDKGAITTLRTVPIDERYFHVWSCTFVRDGRGYRFLAWAPEYADNDMAVLRRVVLATELL